MPHPSKKALQAKKQRTDGKTTFTKIIGEDPGSEWEEDEEEQDDDDMEWKEAKSGMRRMHWLFLPKCLQSVMAIHFLTFQEQKRTWHTPSCVRSEEV